MRYNKMIIEFMIIFQIATLISFGIAYKQRDEILWAITLILTGVMIFSSTNIGLHTYALNNDNTPGLVMFSYNSVEVMALNVGIFLISIIYFFIDLIANHWLTIKDKIVRKKNGKATNNE
jgi:hypothetical protein